MVQNLSGAIFFRERVEFLISGIWFQFYASSNKDTLFDSTGTIMYIVTEETPHEPST